MLETKRQRGWVIVGVVAIWLLVGIVWAVGSNRAADDNFEAFSDRAHATFDGSDAAEFQARFDDSATTDASGFTRYVSQAGDVTDVTRNPPSARYALPDAWGRSLTATVTWTDNGIIITQD